MAKCHVTYDQFMASPNMRIRVDFVDPLTGQPLVDANGQPQEPTVIMPKKCVFSTKSVGMKGSAKIQLIHDGRLMEFQLGTVPTLIGSKDAQLGAGHEESSAE